MRPRSVGSRWTTGSPVHRPWGGDTWNTLGCDIDEDLVEREANALVESGMRDAGYRYVVVDDCWFAPNRGTTGELQASPSRFPDGMRALGDFLHARGLQFGLYESPSTQTCAQLAGAYPGATGSAGHEVQDARTFAAWGVDYLKYDWCSHEGTTTKQVAAFARMRDALAATGRPVVLSINPNSAHATTGARRYWGDVANLWRTTQDITPAWRTGDAGGTALGVSEILAAEVPLAGLSAPGGYDDPDMLEVGRAGLSLIEQRSHFALWAMLAAPLIAGNDVVHQDAATAALLQQRTLVAIDQDALGRQAEQVAGGGSSRVLVKPLTAGRVAVALVNEGDSTRRLVVRESALGLPGRARSVTDVWSGRVARSTGVLSCDVPAHGTAVYLLALDASTTPGR